MDKMTITLRIAVPVFIVLVLLSVYTGVHGAKEIGLRVALMIVSMVVAIVSEWFCCVRIIGQGFSMENISKLSEYKPVYGAIKLVTGNMFDYRKTKEGVVIDDVMAFKRCWFYYLLIFMAELTLVANVSLLARIIF